MSSEVVDMQPTPRTADQPPRAVNELVGERIHRELWTRRISQTEFAPKLNLSQSALSKKLRGERAFGIDEVLAIAFLLKMPVEELLPQLDRAALLSLLSGLNRRPFAYKVRSSRANNSPCEVIVLRPSGT